MVFAQFFLIKIGYSFFIKRRQCSRCSEKKKKPVTRTEAVELSLHLKILEVIKPKKSTKFWKGSKLNTIKPEMCQDLIAFKVSTNKPARKKYVHYVRVQCEALRQWVQFWSLICSILYFQSPENKYLMKVLVSGQVNMNPPLSLSLYVVNK